jgi:hypothetical protein
VTRSRLILLGIAAVALGGVLWVAWQWWPPLLRYRLHRLESREVAIEQTYLDGSQGLEPSAKALASLWQEQSDLWGQLASYEPSQGGGSLTAIASPSPAGVSPNDPRLRELGERSMQIMMGPEMWRRFQQMRSASHDTT